MARFWSHSWASPFGERKRVANPIRILLGQLSAFASSRLCVEFRLNSYGSVYCSSPDRPADGIAERPSGRAGILGRFIQWLDEPNNSEPRRSQRGKATTETERDRAPVAAAPHAEGGLVKLGVPMRAGPLRAGTARAPPTRPVLRSLRAISTIAVRRTAEILDSENLPPNTEPRRSRLSL